MGAGTYNITIDQGSDFALDMTVKESGVPRDLTGFQARAQIRTKKTSTALTAEFVCTVPDAVNGNILMSMDNAVTEALEPGRYFYDLEIYSAGDASVTRILEGRAEVRAEVTR